ncbi:PREDICTED: putative receptor-like protein kinase At3g46340 [Brassica oleracea var. oleracea]|uniref:putative receptor-like protein kinase At3g46340 n=1 Tax=Brassica oleracea var. oleracea TaxID=109376 RepID=UPI0006A6F6D2|nr:PREDICTED: putative receptor-like protein kinase At3g46340 [Brassica oleracea var. oleracea]
MELLLLIDLRKNKLNGSIPKALRDRENKGLKLFVDGYETKCSSSSCVPKKKFPVMTALAASAVVVIGVVLILFFLFRKKMRSSQATNVSEHLIETKRRRFTYTEVVEMTKNFQKALGEGGFGVRVGTDEIY